MATDVIVSSDPLDGCLDASKDGFCFVFVIEANVVCSNLILERSGLSWQRLGERTTTQTATATKLNSFKWLCLLTLVERRLRSIESFARRVKFCVWLCAQLIMRLYFALSPAPYTPLAMLWRGVAATTTKQHKQHSLRLCVVHQPLLCDQSNAFRLSPSALSSLAHP